MSFIGNLYKEGLLPVTFMTRVLESLIFGTKAIEQVRAARLLFSFCDQRVLVAASRYIVMFHTNLPGIATSYSGEPVKHEELWEHGDVSALPSSAFVHGFTDEI